MADKTEQVTGLRTESEAHLSRVRVAEAQARASAAEAEALRSFLSIGDKTSAEAVRGKLKDINDRIQELVNENLDLWVFQDQQHHGNLSREEVRHCQRKLTECIGLPIVEALREAKQSDEAAFFLLQSAWEACLVVAVWHLLGDFSCRTDPQNKQSLLLVKNVIRQAGLSATT